MTAHPGDIRSPIAAADVAVSDDPWRGAWLLLASLLVTLVAVIGFALWVALGSVVDADVVTAAQPAMQVVFRYFGFEFVGDGLGFGGILIVSALTLSRNRSNWFAWLFCGSILLWMLSNALLGLFALATAGELSSAWVTAMTICAAMLHGVWISTPVIGWVAPWWWLAWFVRMV